MSSLLPCFRFPRCAATRRRREASSRTSSRASARRNLFSTFGFVTLRLGDKKVGKPRVRIEANHPHRIGNEIGKRVHVVIKLPPGVVVDDILDAANLNARE